ncbi:MAG: Imm8 family immunity protein [Verrucomicrobiota bacterium]
MRLELKGLVDWGGIIDQPAFDPKNCSVPLWVDVGIDDEEGANQFDLQVVTPTFLSSCEKSTWGQSLLVVPVFTWENVEREIEELIAGIPAKNWDDAVKMLTRFMHWEYEGMEGSDQTVLVPFPGQ